MKTSQLFWGFIFITVGSLTLSVRYNWVDINFEMLRDMWPVLLVLAGIAVIFKETKLKPLIHIIFGITIGSILFAYAHGIFYNEDFYDEDFDSDISSGLSESYYSDYDYATLIINGGAGEFKIEGTTNKLYEAAPLGIFSNYSATVEPDDNGVEISLNLEEDIELFNNHNNKLLLKLNKNPIWNLEFNIGASNSDFDLQEFKVRRIKLSTGAANTNIRLSNKLKRTDLNIKMGAASVNLHIPKDMGCRVISNSFLVVNDLPGFIKKSDGNYESKNFDTSDKKVFVNIEGGLANFEVKWY